MENVIFDLDDFAEQPERNCLNELIVLKNKFPNLKVTLFAIPNYGGVDQSEFFHFVNSHYGDWIQLAVHGWDHHDNFECSKWTYKEAENLLKEAWFMGCFVKVFKAPGWQISRDTYSVLKNSGFICADHHESAYTEPGIPNKDRRPKTLKVYEIDHPWMVHGHTWNCCNNGLPELMEKWEKEGYPFDKETKFHFITELF
jgi:hypothetical protein